MSPKPLTVAICALVSERKILLIERRRGDYVGLLGLPGGKVELDEHVSGGAVREIREESGMDSVFESHLGVVSEHLVEDGEITQHFLLHVCRLRPLTTDITVDSEGKLDWYDLDGLEGMKDRIIPSDYLMIENMVLGRGGKGYYECVLEKEGEGHRLVKFT